MEAIDWTDKGDIRSQNISVRLNIDDYNKIKEISERYGVKVGSVVREIVKHYFQNIEKGGENEPINY